MFTTAGMTLLITFTIGSFAMSMVPGGGVTFPCGATSAGILTLAGDGMTGGGFEVCAASRPGSRTSAQPEKRTEVHRKFGLHICVIPARNQVTSMKTLRTYLPPAALRETSLPAPTEMEMQALWFEQLYQSPLTTDDGRTVEIIQPGFWNHGGGPDFTRAAVRFSDKPEVVLGQVEVHLRADDWHLHGHHADSAYDETILHVVWEKSKTGKTLFPATSSFRRVPQVVLGTQLVAPWAELQPLCTEMAQTPRPGAVAGRCSAELARLAPERVLEIVRTAGLYRVRQKARRWYWRGRIAGTEQVERLKNSRTVNSRTK